MWSDDCSYSANEQGKSLAQITVGIINIVSYLCFINFAVRAKTGKYFYKKLWFAQMLKYCLGFYES